MCGSRIRRAPKGVRDASHFADDLVEFLDRHGGGGEEGDVHHALQRHRGLHRLGHPGQFEDDHQVVLTHQGVNPLDLAAEFLDHPMGLTRAIDANLLQGILPLSKLRHADHRISYHQFLRHHMP